MIKQWFRKITIQTWWHNWMILFINRRNDNKPAGFGVRQARMKIPPTKNEKILFNISACLQLTLDVIPATLQPFQQDQVGISPSMNGIRAEEWTYWKYWNKMNHVHPSQSRFLLQSARVTSTYGWNPTVGCSWHHGSPANHHCPRHRGSASLRCTPWI